MLREVYLYARARSLSRALFIPALFCGVSLIHAEEAVVDFSELALPEPESHWNGETGEGGFVSAGFLFPNEYTDWGDGFYSWDGFAYSNHTDTETPGIGNQYSAFSDGGGGVGDSPAYAVAYAGSGSVEVEAPRDHSFSPNAIWVTNTTYAALSMRDGDDFAKQFGGEDGTDPDTFVLTIEGVDGVGGVTGEAAVYLADYRGDKSEIVDAWKEVDLSGLGDGLHVLRFSLESTDVGDFGMNTPAYFAIGRLTAAVAPAIFPDATSGVATKRFREGFGSYDDTYYPWIWHRFWGWIYWSGERTDSGILFWSPGAGWVYGDVEVGGYYFSYARMRWWFYQETGQQAAIYDFEESRWIDSPPYSEP